MPPGQPLFRHSKPIKIRRQPPMMHRRVDVGHSFASDSQNIPAAVAFPQNKTALALTVVFLIIGGALAVGFVWSLVWQWRKRREAIAALAQEQQVQQDQRGAAAAAAAPRYAFFKGRPVEQARFDGARYASRSSYAESSRRSKIAESSYRPRHAEASRASRAMSQATAQEGATGSQAGQRLLRRAGEWPDRHEYSERDFNFPNGMSISTYPPPASLTPFPLELDGTETGRRSYKGKEVVGHHRASSNRRPWDREQRSKYEQRPESSRLETIADTPPDTQDQDLQQTAARDSQNPQAFESMPMADLRGDAHAAESHIIPPPQTRAHRHEQARRRPLEERDNAQTHAADPGQYSQRGCHGLDREPSERRRENRAAKTRTAAKRPSAAQSQQHDPRNHARRS